MRKVFTSLILLLLVQAIAPAAAWANSIVFGLSNSNGLLNIAMNSTGTGAQSWNQFQMQFTGRPFYWSSLEQRVLDLLDRQQCVERNRTCKLEFDLLPDT